ncbi:hypothetical protein ALC62_07393 [Cyphomyrmex costatus]|uniref:Uncharacterized protein n=1 Tax=Cyphomyrmex costatus TaxID=456900 RepID=A0A151IHQ8_9HYME|nr:hypothetical protein ALC62_07393 [Cyphomyrmex costatus]
MFSKNSNNDSVSVSQISAGLEEAIGPTIHKDLYITYMDIDEQQRQNKKRPLPSSTEDEDLIRSSQTPPAKKSTGEKESVSNSGLSHNLQAKSHVTLDTDRLTQASNNQIVSRYGPRDAGPYVVYVYPTARDNALHATLVSRIIVKEKNTLYERAKEIMGETATQGLLNPFDSDYIDENVHNKENIIEILEEDNENDPAVFSHLIKNNEITDWKTWNSKKLKSQISAPLKNNNMETVSTQKGLKKRKYDSDKEYQKTLDEAKIDLTNTFKENIEEKQTYEIEILKHQLEKEKLKIELLKLIIDKEKSIKQNEEKSNVHVTL